LYRWLYQNYHKWASEGVDMHEFLEYRSAIAEFLILPPHYQMRCQYMFPLCLWMILISLHKRGADSKFPLILL
jgi:hypothetical protein